MYNISLETLRKIFGKQVITIKEAVLFALFIYSPRGKELRKILYDEQI